MKTKKITTIIALVLTFTTQAQKSIMVESVGKQNYYETLNKAIDNLKDNDKVYLPGGRLRYVKKDGKTLDTLKIVKNNITFYGVGHDARHTGIQAPSEIVGKPIRVAGKGITFIGMKIWGGVYVEKKMSVLIKACSVENLIEFKESSRGFLTSNILNEIWVDNNASVDVFNNILRYCASIVLKGIHKNVYANLYLKNNVITDQVYAGVVGGSVRTENNIFTWSSPIRRYLGSFKNNIFKGKITFPNNVPSINNLFGIKDIKFVDTKDYVLKKDSPAKGTGTNGVDCGIYGGATPFKFNSITPKIVKLDIANTTNSEGQLKVSIKVEAQKK